MGCMTKQWQNTGVGKRTSTYRGQEVTISSRKQTASEFSDAWRVVLELNARIPLGEQYQAMHLTLDECELIATDVVDLCSPNKRTEIACSILNALPDTEFLAAVSEILQRRLRKRVS